MTVSKTFTADASLGVDIEGISIGGGISSTSSSEVTMSNSTTFTVEPGRQVVMTMGVLQHSETGNVQVNFPDRQAGHFEVREAKTSVIWLIV